MNSADSITGLDTLSRTLEALGVDASATYALLIRKNRVLCALPKDREVARRTLSMYQPQRLQSKLVKRIIRAGIECGCHFSLLKPWTRGAANGFKDRSFPGIMIGSTGHHCERAIACLYDEGDWQICKVSFGEKGHDILNREARMLEAMAADFPDTPRLLGIDHKGELALLRMVFQEGKPWEGRDLRLLLELLGSWLNRGPEQRLSEFENWGMMANVLRRSPRWADQADDISLLKLRPAIQHGDLTRPNLRISQQGRLLVHDWERGSLHGIPGIDLVHFLVQDLCFSKRFTNHKIVEDALASLKSPACSTFVRDMGWAGRERELMALAFAFNTGAAYIDQTEMLELL